MFSDDSLQKISDVTKLAVERSCKELSDGDIVDEDDFSSALMSSLRDKLNDLRLELALSPSPAYGSSSATEYTVHARTTTSRYAGSEENFSGADILMGFRGQFDNEAIKKAVLIQAKLFSGKGEFLTLPEGNTERTYLKQQCKRMIEVAGSSSYILIYSRIAVRFYSAVDYVAEFPEGLSYEAGQDFYEFVKDLFSCKIGNHNFDYMPKGEFRPYLDTLGIKHGFDAKLEEA